MRVKEFCDGFRLVWGNSENERFLLTDRDTHDDKLDESRRLVKTRINFTSDYWCRKFLTFKQQLTHRCDQGVGSRDVLYEQCIYFLLLWCIDLK